jgi:hypothetical protein
MIVSKEEGPILEMTFLLPRVALKVSLYPVTSAPTAGGRGRWGGHVTDGAWESKGPSAACRPSASPKIPWCYSSTGFQGCEKSMAFVLQTHH